MGIEDQTDYAATWYCGVTPLPALRTPLNYDLDVDVCVVGGGLAGLTVAREVARRGWKRSSSGSVCRPPKRCGNCRRPVFNIYAMPSRKTALLGLSKAGAGLT